MTTPPGWSERWRGTPTSGAASRAKLLPARRQVERLEVGVGGEQLLERRLLVPGDAAGHLADLAVGAAVDLGHLAERAAEAEAVVVGHHRGLRMGIAAEDVGQHVVALVPGEVEVDVGRVLPLGVEEALEQEPGAERLDVGDAEAVAHDRVGDGAAAAVGGAVGDDVAHDEEVVGEALHPDDGELVLEPVAGHRGDGAVAALGALVGEGAELLEGVAHVGEARGDDAADRNPVAAALGDLIGGAHRLGAVGELALEVGGGAEPGVAGDRRSDGRTVGRSDGRTDRRSDGRTVGRSGRGRTGWC